MGVDGGTSHLVPLGSWVPVAVVALLTFGPVDQWPACLRGACVVSGWVMKDVNADVVDEFVYLLDGVGLAILMMRMQHEQGVTARGRAGLLSPDEPRPGSGRSYPWGELLRLLPQLAGDQRCLRLMPRLPQGWKKDGSGISA